jgi:hypothetical protein
MLMRIPFYDDEVSNSVGFFVDKDVCLVCEKFGNVASYGADA